jgi:hypothetical protein
VLSSAINHSTCVCHKAEHAGVGRTVVVESTLHSRRKRVGSHCYLKPVVAMGRASEVRLGEGVAPAVSAVSSGAVPAVPVGDVKEVKVEGDSGRGRDASADAGGSATTDVLNGGSTQTETQPLPDTANASRHSDVIHSQPHVKYAPAESGDRGGGGGIDDGELALKRCVCVCVCVCVIQY